MADQPPLVCFPPPFALGRRGNLKGAARKLLAVRVELAGPHARGDGRSVRQQRLNCPCRRTSYFFPAWCTLQEDSATKLCAQQQRSVTANHTMISFPVFFHNRHSYSAHFTFNTVSLFLLRVEDFSSPFPLHPFLFTLFSFSFLSLTGNKNHLVFFIHRHTGSWKAYGCLGVFS